MPPSAARQTAPLALICGDDEFAVKQRARELFSQWSAELGGTDHETIDAAAGNSREALAALGKLRESLQTLPFFGSAKVVWLKNCTFLGDDRTASTAAVTEALSELGDELKGFSFQSVRLLISAGKVDKRKSFYKTLDKLGSVENLSGWSLEDRDWVSQAEAWAERSLREKGKSIADGALAELVARVGPHRRQLEMEIEKVSLYCGERKEIVLSDVAAVCARNKSARAFALGDALGDRDLPRLLSCLDSELWEVKLDPDRSAIGVLYGLISKVRSLILLKEMVREGWIQPTSDFSRFKLQLSSVPADQMPQDRKFNPLAINPYVLFKALSQVKRYSQEELVKAMDLLLQCNRRLVSSGLEQALVLQQTLVQIVS